MELIVFKKNVCDICFVAGNRLLDIVKMSRHQKIELKVQFSDLKFAGLEA